VWGEAAGGEGDEQVIRERDVDAIFAFGLRGWLVGCSHGCSSSCESQKDCTSLHGHTWPGLASLPSILPPRAPNCPLGRDMHTNIRALRTMGALPDRTHVQ
jgi:hypothetical protein